MTELTQSWNFDELSPEARRTAQRAAEAAGMPLDTWLNQLIKYVSSMELKGEAPDGDNGLDKTIEALALAQGATAEPGAPPETRPPEDRPDADRPDIDRPEDRPDTDRPDTDRPTNDLLPGEDARPGDGIAFEGGAPRETDAPPENDPPLGDPDSDVEAAGYDRPPPTSLPPDLLSPSRFEEEPSHERDVESAIGGWRKAGSLLPVIVRPDGREKGRYEIITGAERWRAAIRLKMKLVPVAVTTVSDDELLRATLIERLRRRSSTPIEEARTYRRILTQTGQSVVGLATDIGCAPSQITGALQLLGLPDPVQAMIEEGKLTMLHARALLQADDPEAAARVVVARQLDIYQTEQLVRNPAAPPAAPAETDEAETDEAETGESETDESETGRLEPGGNGPEADARDAGPADENEDDADIRMVEKTLSSLLGVEVSIDGGASAGVLSIRYGEARGLRDIVSRLNREPPRS